MTVEYREFTNWFLALVLRHHVPGWSIVVVGGHPLMCSDRHTWLLKPDISAVRPGAIVGRPVSPIFFQPTYQVDAPAADRRDADRRDSITSLIDDAGITMSEYSYLTE